MRVLSLSPAGESCDPNVASVLAEAGYLMVDAAFEPSSIDGAARGRFHLAIIDPRGPDHRVVAFVADLRSQAPAMSILVLSPCASPIVRAEILEAGADDCVSRPVSAGELRARIRLLGRAHAARTVRYGRLLWNWQYRRGEIGKTLLRLSRAETALLEALLQSPNEVVPIATLARCLEPQAGSDSRNRLYVYMSRLRKRVAEAGLTVRSASRFGYFIATA